MLLLYLLSFPLSSSKLTALLCPPSPFSPKVLNKVLAVFVTLCHEIHMLKEEATCEFYGPLLVYGEGSAERGLEEGESQLHMGAMLPFLQVCSRTKDDRE